MSNKAISWALRQKIPPTEKFVLVAICNGANDKEALTCRRSLSLLASETGFDRRTVLDAVKGLIANGKIERVGTHQDGSTIYRVVPVVLHPQAQWCSTINKNRKQKKEVVQHPHPSGVAPPVPVVQHPHPGGAPPHITKEPNKPNEPNRERRAQKTRAPATFPITDSMRDWARGNGITINLEEATARWLDHFIGTGELRENWHATWREGMRRAQDWSRENGKRVEGTDSGRLQPRPYIPKQ